MNRVFFVDKKKKSLSTKERNRVKLCQLLESLNVFFNGDLFWIGEIISKFIAQS